jgi:hypothetical protein
MALRLLCTEMTMPSNCKEDALSLARLFIERLAPEGTEPNFLGASHACERVDVVRESSARRSRSRIAVESASAAGIRDGSVAQVG